MRIAFMHDYLTQYGGAERVLDVLYSTFADSPRHVYTSMYVAEHLPTHMREWPVTTSVIDRVPFGRRTHRAWLPFYPAIFRGLGRSVTDANIVVADSSAWAHHAAPPGDIPFLVYCHSPARFLYGDEHYLDAVGLPSTLARLANPMFDWLRRQDVKAAQRPNRIVANSVAVQHRIKTLWDRDACVVHPPVDTRRFQPDGDVQVQSWFLVVSRLVPHKWIDRAIEASNATGLPLRIVGSGRAERSLRDIAGPQVEFLGQLGDHEVVAAMQQCQALILPGVEDFGMTAVETQSAGRPVIAAGVGGARETVREGETGLLVPVGDVDALAEAMRTVARQTWDSQAIIDHAGQFDVRHFRRQMREIVEDLLATR